MCPMSYVTCHGSHVTCHVSHVMCNVSCVIIYIFFLHKVLELVGGGSVINGAYPVLFNITLAISYNTNQIMLNLANMKKKVYEF